MKNIIYLLIIPLFLTGCQQKKEKSESPHEGPLPNIVLIVGDDHGYPYFGFMEADYMHTPNIDELAATGVVFTHGYVPANHCKPSLQSLITGTVPEQYESDVVKMIGKELKKKEHRDLSDEEKKDWEREFRFHAMKHFKTLPGYLAEKGYVSFQGGKWWEFNYQNGGFTEGMSTGWTQEELNKPGWFQKYMGGEGTKLGRNTMQPVYDFIDTYHEKPFFIWYAPELPHWPFDAPAKYYEIYKDKDMSESAKKYYANCSWFDDGLGQLMHYLHQKGLSDNTLFVYVNDNGWEQNPDQEFRHDSARWHNGGDKGKRSMFDQSFRTPIIFTWKDHITPGVFRDDLMHSTDIPATILDYVDLPIPGDYHGISFKDAIAGEESDLRSEIIGCVDGIRVPQGVFGGRPIDGSWIRTDEWFLNWEVDNDIKSLYNMKSDPNNDNDVADEYPELVEELTGKILQWRKENGK